MALVALSVYLSSDVVAAFENYTTLMKARYFRAHSDEAGVEDARDSLLFWGPTSWLTYRKFMGEYNSNFNPPSRLSKIFLP